MATSPSVTATRPCARATASAFTIVDGRRACASRIASRRRSCRWRRPRRRSSRPQKRLRQPTDTFFNFDKAMLHPEGQAAFDDVSSRLAGSDYDSITIVGHADRIGTPQYNLGLSERRANAMRDYLVAKGIDAQKISASGVGSSEPTAQCPQLRGTRLVACLQPDRYAEVTVAGTAVQVSSAPAN
ncbi:MAG: OmpA family protein [Betaproteobacteria bacterium]|nr:MAG: OmpA family protein [Betaproteobacteria bacterium]